MRLGKLVGFAPKYSANRLNISSFCFIKENLILNYFH